MTSGLNFNNQVRNNLSQILLSKEFQGSERRYFWRLTKQYDYYNHWLSSSKNLKSLVRYLMYKLLVST